MIRKCDLLRIRELDRSFNEVCHQEFIIKEKENEVIRKKQIAIQAEHLTLKEDIASQRMSIEGKNI